MMCISPISIKDDRGRPGMLVPCGQCIACRLNKAREWSIRIANEARYYDDSIFLTLTYDDEHLPADKSVHKDELQRFLKRLRKLIFPDKIRYFACGEYGGQFGRPHYHAIIFNLSGFDSRVFSDWYKSKNDGYFVRCKAWQKGWVHFGYVTEESGGYVARYTLKKVKGKGATEHYKELGIEPEFALMSLKPGIGSAFMAEFRYDILRNGTVMSKSGATSAPRYYKDKLGYKNTIGYQLKRERELKEYLSQPLDLSAGYKHVLEQEQKARNIKERFKDV